MTNANVFQVYRIPALLAVLTCVGLLSGLFGAGVWDMFSWLALAVPLVVIAWKWCRSLR